MDYNFNLEHPFFFTNNDYSTDTSIKYQVSLPFNWHEVMNNDEWVYQYPIGKFVERQGWKIHISSEYNSSHELLQDVAKICHEMRIPFKHLSTEDKFIMRNGKLVSRGFSGKFITCYPNQNELESVLQRLESALKQYNGPYILSDKRWDEAPIYLRYGVFRPSRDDEKKVAIDELIVGDEVVKDERLPVFKIPKGIVPPDFLNKWLDKKDKKQGDFPFIIDNAIRFSNSGGIYNARLKEDGKKIILKEARPYTGLGFDGTYSSEKLASECKALKILNEWSETPKIYWHGKIWEHTFLGIEHMKGVPLNRWVTNNFPLYEVVDKTKDYLLRVSKIVEKLIDLTNKFHSENVYHQDLHLGNILVKDEDEISIIDWEQAVFSNDEKVVHKVAAPGFRAWRETLPSEIDWYGIRQIAHYLYMPLVTTSDLTYNYVSQTRIEGKKLFESLGYTREHIDYVESLLSYLDSKCPQIENISRKKVLKPMHEIRTIESEQDIQDFIIKLLRGFTLTYGQWRKEFQSRFFPVHYYGLNFNQGIAFSDLAILWSYQQLAKKVKNFKFDDYYEIRTQVINEAVNNFKKSSLSGLFDGKIGTIWLIYEFGEIDRAVELFTTHFIEIFENSQNKNLYSGQAGILLVGLYFLSKGEIDNKLGEEILIRLREYTLNYIENPETFCKVGASDVQSNDPYENFGGLLYGHAGVAWLFGEAYKLTGESIYKNGLELAVDKELVAYKVDSNNSLQYSQGHRLLPYLATGSAGLLLLINRNKEILSSKYLKYLTSLERATDVAFCVLPGLFNGFCGLEVANNIYSDIDDNFSGQKKLIEQLYRYLCVIEEGFVIAGDNGLKITTDIASGFAGVAIGLVSIMDNKLTILPQI
ncbi:lantibiotic synthetase [Streptococcus pneumoniae]|nr:lantibiotic synthetase [Streptococcus pneumoniae]VML41844.1 lantibiotic synthetase [Streptococcus pneumoniae]VRW25412.1 lantibiotic synthetase [Streptococcus pneumoniae]